MHRPASPTYRHGAEEANVDHPFRFFVILMWIVALFQIVIAALNPLRTPTRPRYLRIMFALLALDSVILALTLTISEAMVEGYLPHGDFLLTLLAASVLLMACLFCVATLSVARTPQAASMLHMTPRLRAWRYATNTTPLGDDR
jgi:hypothetical protein